MPIRKNNKIFSLTSTSILCMALAACGGGGGGGGGTPDTTAPIITLSGNATENVTQGAVYTDAGAMANDDVDGDISANITVGGDTVDTSTSGSYTITYNVSDASGNAATEVTREVVVGSVASSLSFKMPALNDTGLTQGANYPDDNNLDCSGEHIAAQDCSSGRDKQDADGNLSKVGGGMAGFDFTKIAADGSVLVVQDQAWDDLGNENAGTQWSCVRDNHTGLIWEVKINAVQGATLHSNADTFVWHESNSSINGGFSGSETSFATPDTCHGYDENNSATYCNTQAFVARVNSAGLCGADDWYLPNVLELFSITNQGIFTEGSTLTSPIDTDYFPNIGAPPATENNYWTSTTAVAANAPGSYVVNFLSLVTDSSSLHAFSKASPYAVRLVHKP